MFNAIKKKFSKQPNEAKEATQMKQKDSQPDMVANDNVAAQLAAALEQNTKIAADLQALTELVEELSAQSEAAKAALAASEAAKATLVQEAAAKRLEARTKAVEAAVGTSKAAGILAATEALADEQFNAIVDAMAASFDAEANSLLFKEVGAAASADATQDAPEETEEMKILKAKYAQSK